MAGKIPEEAGFEPLLDLLKDGRAQILMENIAKSAAEHVLLRIGINASDPQAVLQAQSDQRFLRENRDTIVLATSRMAEVANELREHQREDSRQFAHIVGNQNVAAQDRAGFSQQLQTIERKAIETKDALEERIDGKVGEVNDQLFELSKSLNRLLLGLVITIAIAVIGGIASKVFFA